MLIQPLPESKFAADFQRPHSLINVYQTMVVKWSEEVLDMDVLNYILRIRFLYVFQAVEVLAGHERLFGSLLQTLETALASEGGQQAGGEVASALINWVLQAEGFQRAREIYTR